MVPYPEVVIPIALSALAGAASWVLRVEKKVSKVDEVHSTVKEMDEKVDAIMWHLATGRKVEPPTKRQ